MKTNCIIVTHNRLPLLKECLGAVEAQSYPVDKIIVIDNCSTDGTEDFLARQDNRRIEVIRLPQNIGGAGGFSGQSENPVVFLLPFPILRAQFG